MRLGPSATSWRGRGTPVATRSPSVCARDGPASVAKTRSTVPARRAEPLTAPLGALVFLRLLPRLGARRGDEQHEVPGGRLAGVHDVVPEPGRAGVRLPFAVVLDPGDADRPALGLDHERALEHVQERRGEVALFPGLAAGRQLDDLAGEGGRNRQRDAGDRPGGADETPALDALRLRRLRVLRVRGDHARHLAVLHGRARHEREQPDPDCDGTLESHWFPPQTPNAPPNSYLITAPVMPEMNLSRKRL